MVSARRKIRAGKKSIGSKSILGGVDLKLGDLGNITKMVIFKKRLERVRQMVIQQPREELFKKRDRQLQIGEVELCLTHSFFLTDSSYHHFVVSFYPKETLCCGSSVMKILSLSSFHLYSLVVYSSSIIHSTVLCIISPLVTTKYIFLAKTTLPSSVSIHPFALTFSSRSQTFHVLDKTFVSFLCFTHHSE